MKRNILFILISFLLVYCNNRNKNPNENIFIYEQSIESIIDKYAEIEVLGDSIVLPEGPVWDKYSNSLLFVDIMQNRVLKWNENTGVKEFISPSGNTGYAPNLGEGILGANGLSLNKSGELVLCQHGDRRLAKISNTQNYNPTFTTVVDNFNGNRLNSPNDLVISKNGTIYFTDPPFVFFDLNTFSFVKTDMKELGFNGVFKFNPNENKLTLLSKEIQVPNGIGLSPDEKFLYVNSMGAPFATSTSKIIRIELENNESETFFDEKDLSGKYEGNFDGMAVHSSGNIFTSGPGGLLVISPEGDLKARINFGDITNCTFDDKEKYLYVTGFLSNPKLFRLKMKD